MSAEKINDCWETPQWLFDELNSEFKFHIDICASAENSKCEYFCFDVFTTWVYGGNCVLFMNPPYSKPYPFIAKAWELAQENTVVCLVKCDPSTKWWAIFWDHTTHKPRPGCEVRFLPKRVKFDPPKGWTGGVSGPSYPSAIIVMDRRYT